MRARAEKPAGIKTFAGLLDTPASNSGQGKKVVKVKPTEDGLEYGGDILSDGDIEISKADPKINLTDTRDGNSARLIRNNALSKMNLYNTVFKPGELGNALRYDGINQTARKSGVNLNIGTGVFSLVSWVKPISSPGQELFLFIGNQAGNQAVYLEFDASANDKFQVGWWGGATNAIADSTSTLNDYHLVIATYDGTHVRLYVDGVLATAPVSVVASNIGTDWIILSGAATVAFFEGDQDLSAIYKRVLTANDASDLWNSGNGREITLSGTFPTDGTPMGLNLGVLFDLNQSSGTNVPDNSGNGDNLTTLNLPVWVFGKINTGGAYKDVSCVELKDSGSPGVAGEVTVGQNGSDAPKVILEGETLRFNISGIEKGQVDENGNLGLGTSSFGTNAAGVFGLGNGTASSSSPADMVTQYVDKVSGFSELHVRDEAGNVTIISPHPTEFLNTLPVDENHILPFAYHSKNAFIGKEIFIDLELLAREVARLSGKTIVYVNEIPVKSWDANQLINEKKYLKLAIEAEVEKEHEIPIDEALEEVVIKEKVQAGTSLEYKLSQDGTVEEIQVPRYENNFTGQTKKQLKPRVRFDTNTGKFYKKRTEYEITKQIEDGIITLKPFNKKQAPKWIKDRMK